MGLGSLQSLTLVYVQRLESEFMILKRKVDSSDSSKSWSDPWVYSISWSENYAYCVNWENWRRWNKNWSLGWFSNRSWREPS